MWPDFFASYSLHQTRSMLHCFLPLFCLFWTSICCLSHFLNFLYYNFKINSLSWYIWDVDFILLAGASTYLILVSLQFKFKDEQSLRSAAFPLSLLSFQNLIYPLDEKLTLSGLGYDYGIDEEVARRSASLHYNGNMKPWLELGITHYKKYWKRFLVRGDQFMDECNVNP